MAPRAARNSSYMQACHYTTYKCSGQPCHCGLPWTPSTVWNTFSPTPACCLSLVPRLRAPQQGNTRWPVGLLVGQRAWTCSHQKWLDANHYHAKDIQGSGSPHFRHYHHSVGQSHSHGYWATAKGIRGPGLQTEEECTSMSWRMSYIQTMPLFSNTSKLTPSFMKSLKTW